MPAKKRGRSSNQDLSTKFLKTLFLIPVYLRSEKQYHKEEEKAKKLYKKKHGEVQFGKRVDDWFFWPPWEVNDIIGYIQIGIDPDGLFRFMVFGIDCIHGYKRITRNPTGRNRNMWGIDYREYFDEDIIECEDGYLGIDLPTAEIKRCLISFMSELHEKLITEKKHITLDYWHKFIRCLDIKEFVKYLS